MGKKTHETRVALLAGPPTTPGEGLAAPRIIFRRDLRRRESTIPTSGYLKHSSTKDPCGDYDRSNGHLTQPRLQSARPWTSRRRGAGKDGREARRPPRPNRIVTPKGKELIGPIFRPNTQPKLGKSLADTRRKSLRALSNIEKELGTRESLADRSQSKVQPTLTQRRSGREADVAGLLAVSVHLHFRCVF